MGHEISVTLLQLAMAYGAVANGGFLMKPLIIKALYDNSWNLIYEESPRIIRRVASEKTMAYLRQILQQVVEKGTGKQVQIPGIKIAGKTGTAQKVINGSYSNTDFVASFIGFFPADNPVLLCAVVIDNPKSGGHWGGTVAAPVVREIFKRIINSTDFLYIPLGINNPLLAENFSPKSTKKKSLNTQFLLTYVTENEKDNSKTRLVPDLKGQSLREALSILYQLNLKATASGSGIVYSQNPKAGTTIPPDGTVSIKLKKPGSK
jgi:membrane peptidoglycan carboxypeptidase